MAERFIAEQVLNTIKY